MRLDSLFGAVTAAFIALPVHAQIERHPTGVNVNAMGATTVFLTFGNLNGKVPVEAMWCGALESALPEIGQRCDPATIFGHLPVRHDLSRASGIDGFTDIMSIPPSVARRAYQAAARGDASEFFYVRRFVDPTGGPDEYVTVTCRLTDGGARTPFGITDVRIAFRTKEAVPAITTGALPPPIEARIAFNGTGRLRARWEIVRPGEDRPTAEDLLPEAALPLELRGQQRRFTEIQRIDVLLPPVGEVIVPGPDPELIATDAPGEYLLLLRIEATDDKEGDSDLAAAGAGAGLVHAGGIAAFPVPPLRYHVGLTAGRATGSSPLRALLPLDGDSLPAATVHRFAWEPAPTALFHRLEVTLPDGTPVAAAMLPAGTVAYDAPVWLLDRATGGSLRWRVVALGTGGRPLATTPWRTLHVKD